MVQLDTGSSDLWLDHAGQKIEDLGGTYIDDERNRKVHIDYALGSVVGRPAYASLVLGGYRVAQQLLLSVESTSNLESLRKNKISGILGLGLESSALLPPLLEAKDASAPTFLGNIFAQSPGGGNFTTWYLGRGGDGLMTINELPEPFAQAAEDAPSHAVWKNPKGARRRARRTAPPFVVLDTGSTLSYMDSLYVDALYSAAKGAKYAPAINVWLLPCASEVSFAFNFKDLRVPLNPLDLVTAPIKVTAGGKDVTICTGALRRLTDDLASALTADMLLGDNFLRNVFTVLHYTENPSIQMINITDEQAAKAQYAGVRVAQLENMPPEADLGDSALFEQIAANLTAPAPSDLDDTTGAACAATHTQALYCLRPEFSLSTSAPCKA
ncbi:acid protease [Auricularia subglabra TFB-10046 SS5]|nr:acid protease [Auricularia subglabra TFB-10046 SS5]